MAVRVGIVGAGNVGESLGRALLRAGYEVMFSSREPSGEHAQKLQAATGAPVRPPAEVIAFGDVVVIAMPADAAVQVARDHAGQWGSKVVIDLTNRFGAAGEDPIPVQIAKITGARVVKAFNTIGAEHYLAPVFEGRAASMFIAGDDAAARETVVTMAADLGFDPVDCGPLSAAEHLESLARFWVYLVRSGHGRDIAFRLLHRA